MNLHLHISKALELVQNQAPTENLTMEEFHDLVLDSLENDKQESQTHRYFKEGTDPEIIQKCTTIFTNIKELTSFNELPYREKINNVKILEGLNDVVESCYYLCQQDDWVCSLLTFKLLFSFGPLSHRAPIPNIVHDKPPQHTQYDHSLERPKFILPNERSFRKFKVPKTKSEPKPPQPKRQRPSSSGAIGSKISIPQELIQHSATPLGNMFEQVQFNTTKLNNIRMSEIKIARLDRFKFRIPAFYSNEMELTIHLDNSLFPFIAKVTKTEFHHQWSFRIADGAVLRPDVVFVRVVEEGSATKASVLATGEVKVNPLIGFPNPHSTTHVKILRQIVLGAVAAKTNIMLLFTETQIYRLVIKHQYQKGYWMQLFLVMNRFDGQVNENLSLNAAWYLLEKFPEEIPGGVEFWFECSVLSDDTTSLITKLESKK